ncbi:hypothetical protein BOX15_Mlig001598g17 [Macrostomum lignano]|uniref:ANK_REP_REGION domain-containing protein n=1 Tax=Macrostomum lignano TaxID=282301 RepID=A0A267ENN8_9PLAT|nr:hypothetical protein BOX15_Mlig001598g17 [Macrostomum lignano]
MRVFGAPETPVHTEKCILYLFELGANPKAADANGDTAAHLAARRDHLRLLTLLSFDAKWLRNKNGATPLMEAARTGSWKCAKHLLHLLRQIRFNECSEHGNSKRSELLGLKNRENRTASDLARLSGHSELTSYIEREMRLVVDAHGWISGLTAQEEADRQKLQRLAEAGDSAGLRRAATRDSCDLPDKWGRTSLMWAAHNRSCCDEALWKQLVHLGDPTCADKYAGSCLHHAARAGNSAAASALLSAGASANATGLGDTSLMEAAEFTPPTATAAAIVRLLLDAGADWSIKNNDGKTPLDLAVENGNIEAAELLRSAANASNSAGASAVSAAGASAVPAAAASAVPAAAASANTKSQKDWTPLMWAAFAPPATAAAVGRVLLDSEADWSLKDRQGRTALDLATEKRRSELAELLRGYDGKIYFDEPLAPP